MEPVLNKNRRQLPGAAQMEALDQLDLASFLRVLRKRRFLVLGTALVTFLMALGISLLMTPKYQATSRIVVNKESSDSLGLDQFQGAMSGAGDLDYTVTLDTQSNIILSDTLALRVISQLHLATNKDFLGYRWWQFRRPPPNPNVLLTNNPALRESLLRMWRAGLTVKGVTGTRLIDISFLSSNPQLSRDVVNALVQDYLEEYYKTRYNATMQASDWLSKQLTDLKKQVEDSQQKMVEYQQKVGIVGTDESHNITMAKLEALNTALTNAQGQRIVRQAIYKIAETGDPELISSLAGTAMGTSSTGAANSLNLIQQLRSQEAAMKAEYADMSTKFGPGYPKMVQMRSQIAQYDRSIKSEIAKLGMRAKNDYLTSKQTEDKLHVEFERQIGQANKLNDSAIKYTIMKHEVDSSRALYDDLLSKLKEAGVLAGLRSTNILVVDPARQPAGPVRPSYPLNLGLGVMFGLVVGVSGAFVLESLDDTIRTPEQVESISDMPTLGIIPLVNAAGAVLGGIRYGGKKKRDELSEVLRTSVIGDPSSQLAESFRSLRTSLLLSNVDAPPHVLLVTSALPGEGKTMISLNIAAVLAQQGSRVLLLDGDMRRPTIHTRVRMKNTVGLSSVLAQGGAPAWEPQDSQPNLFVLPSGIRPPQPAELLGSARMKEFLASCREEFDYVVIDSPPVLAVTDAVVLSQVADATILVVRSGRTTKQSLMRVRDVLKRSNVRMAGVLVNGVNFNSEDYRHYYGYYGSEYGEGYYGSDEGQDE